MICTTATPTTQNFTTYRGDDFIINLTFQDDEGDPVDITGWTVFFTLKDDKDLLDSQAIVQKTITVHVDPTDGISQVHVTNTETSTLVGTFYYDLQYKDDHAVVRTLTEGTVTFFEDVTRRTS